LILSSTLNFIFVRSEKITKSLDFILIRSLFEVEFESVTCLLVFETYRSGMFLDSRGDFAGLGMASLEFDDYAHVV